MINGNFDIVLKLAKFTAFESIEFKLNWNFPIIKGTNVFSRVKRMFVSAGVKFESGLSKRIISCCV